MAQEARVLKVHTAWLRAVAFSPDGKLLASGSADPDSSSRGEVKVWDTDTWKEKALLREPNQATWSVSFSPDGKTLATGILGGHVKLWDLATGKVALILSGHRGAVSSLAFSPDGKLLASAGRGHFGIFSDEDSEVKVWELSTRRELAAIKTGKGGCVAFSPDGKTLVIGQGDKMSVALWDVETRKEKAILQMHRQRPLPYPEWLSSVAVSPDGKTVAGAAGGHFVEKDDNSLSFYGQANLWDIAGSQKPIALRPANGAVWSIAFSPDARLVATGGGDEKADISIWEARTGELLKSVRGERWQVFSVAFSPNSKMLAAGFLDKNVRVWDVAKLVGNSDSNSKGPRRR